MIPTVSILSFLSETMIALRSVKSSQPTASLVMATSCQVLDSPKFSSTFYFRSELSDILPPQRGSLSPLPKAATSYILHYHSLHRASKNCSQFVTIFSFLCTCLLSLPPNKQRTGSRSVLLIVVCFIHDCVTVCVSNTVPGTY